MMDLLWETDLVQEELCVPSIPTLQCPGQGLCITSTCTWKMLEEGQGLRLPITYLSTQDYLFRKSSGFAYTHLLS